MMHEMRIYQKVSMTQKRKLTNILSKTETFLRYNDSKLKSFMNIAILESLVISSPQFFLFTSIPFWDLHKL